MSLKDHLYVRMAARELLHNRHVRTSVLPTPIPDLRVSRHQPFYQTSDRCSRGVSASTLQPPILAGKVPLCPHFAGNCPLLRLLAAPSHSSRGRPLAGMPRARTEDMQAPTGCVIAKLERCPRPHWDRSDSFTHSLCLCCQSLKEISGLGQSPESTYQASH